MKRTERGWAGHFCCAYKCNFRRNTLLEHKDIKIVVSTVGAMLDGGRYEALDGRNRFYETEAFHSKESDKEYHDIDVSRQVTFNSEWETNKLDDIKANEMHEKIVAEIIKGLLSGNKY